MKLKILIVALFCVLVIHGNTAEATGKAKFKSAEREMAYITFLIDRGKAKKALRLVEKSKHLGGASVCGLKSIDIVKLQTHDDGLLRGWSKIDQNTLYRYFNALAGVLFRANRFKDAALCIRHASRSAADARETHDVFIRAWKIVKHLDFRGLNILTDIPSDPKIDLCLDNGFALSKAWGDKTVKKEIEALSPTILITIRNPAKFPATSRRRALVVYREILGRYYLRTAFEHFRSKVAYDALRKQGVKVKKTELVGGFAYGSNKVKKFKSRQSAKAALKKTYQLLPCKSDCDQFTLITMDLRKAELGVYELVVATKGVSSHGPVDGNFYLLYSPKKSEVVQVIHIGETWHEFARKFSNASIKGFSKRSSTIKFDYYSGEYLTSTRNCSAKYVASRDGQQVVCAPNFDGELRCIGWDYWQVGNKHQSFPDLMIAEDGYVVADLTRVDETMWRPSLDKYFGSGLFDSAGLKEIRNQTLLRFSDW